MTQIELFDWMVTFTDYIDTGLFDQYAVSQVHSYDVFIIESNVDILTNPSLLL